MFLRKANGLIVAGAVSVLTMLAVVPASEGQNYKASDALSVSKYGSMHCVDFAALAPRERDHLVRLMAMDAPQQSLTTSAGPNYDAATGKEFSSDTDGASVSGTPLSAGELIAACQAASPRSTLRSAFSRFNSSTPSVPM